MDLELSATDWVEKSEVLTNELLIGFADKKKDSKWPASCQSIFYINVFRCRHLSYFGSLDASERRPKSFPSCNYLIFVFYTVQQMDF